MPIYQYQCDNGHVFEALQKMDDPPIETCRICTAKAHRIFFVPQQMKRFGEFEDILGPLPPKSREKLKWLFDKYVG